MNKPETSDEKDRSNREDIAWMLEAKAGDVSAFSRLVKKHQGPVMNFFVRSGVYKDVEDLAQEAFLKLYRARHRYQPTAKFTTFLYLIARQVMIDSIRHTARQSQLLEGYGNEVRVLESILPAHWERGDAELALSCLSSALRETVVLVLMQGLTYVEAGEVLGIPTGTVKSRVFTALQQMRTRLRANDATEDTANGKRKTDASGTPREFEH